jgi:circadian clock protein KaiB
MQQMITAIPNSIRALAAVVTPLGVDAGVDQMRRRLHRTVRFRFRLYVAGDAPNSMQARFNLKAICRSHCAGSFEIEEVNVLREPLRALADRIRLTPTLIKLSPAPTTRIVGTLADRRRVLRTLGLLDRGE